jgi:hypothetical protein
MRHLSTSAPVLVTAILSLLLIAYVFLSGSGSGKDNAQQARCASREAFALVKADLFRRAAALRPTNGPEFAKLADYAVVRSSSKILRNTDRRSGTVTCTGDIVLDLPPGVEVVGGRRSLGAKMRYQLAGPPRQALALQDLSGFEPITIPLAAVTTSGSATGERLAPPPMPPEAISEHSAGVASAPSAPRPAAARASAPTARVPEPASAPATDRRTGRSAERPVPSPSRSQKPRAAHTATTTVPAKAEPKAAPVTQQVPVAPVAARPSFNCRFARTYGEVAVCRDPALAGLDRQMATVFHRGAAGASPGVRAMLNRSRNRFLRSRDSCRTNECVAQAYRQRIDEISSITSGRF